MPCCAVPRTAALCAMCRTLYVRVPYGVPHGVPHGVPFRSCCAMCHTVYGCVCAVRLTCCVWCQCHVVPCRVSRPCHQQGPNADIPYPRQVIVRLSPYPPISHLLGFVPSSSQASKDARPRMYWGFRFEKEFSSLLKLAALLIEQI